MPTPIKAARSGQWPEATDCASTKGRSAAGLRGSSCWPGCPSPPRRRPKGPSRKSANTVSWLSRRATSQRERAARLVGMAEAKAAVGWLRSSRASVCGRRGRRLTVRSIRVGRFARRARAPHRRRLRAGAARAGRTEVGPRAAALPSPCGSDGPARPAPARAAAPDGGLLQHAALLALAAAGAGVGMHGGQQHGVAVGARVADLSSVMAWSMTGQTR